MKDIERRQPRAGRLDLLLSDPETHTRYEVEVQLGATDEATSFEPSSTGTSRRAASRSMNMLVLEDITSRFLNVINLFNKSIPLIAIQMQALEVDGFLTLNATTVFDLMRLGTDEEEEPGQATDRGYWLQRGSPATVSLADEMLKLVNEIASGMELKYNKYYIGLSRDGIADNFVQLRARKEHLIAEFRIERSDEATALLDDSGLDRLDYDKRWGRYRLRLTPDDVRGHRELLLELIRRAHGSPPPAEE